MDRQLIHLLIAREVVCDGGVKVYELVYDPQFLVADRNHRRLLNFFAHQVCPLQADGQAKVLTGLRGAVHEALQLFRRMGSQHSSID